MIGSAFAAKPHSRRASSWSPQTRQSGSFRAFRPGFRLGASIRGRTLLGFSIRGRLAVRPGLTRVAEGKLVLNPDLAGQQKV